MSAVTLQQFEEPSTPISVRDTTQPGSDQALVRAARRGDVLAFEQLYRRHVDRIYGLCLRMVGNPGRAEDLTQDAFVRAWTKLGSFRSRSAFGTWLYRLTVNLVLGTLRKRSDETVDHLPEVPQPPHRSGLTVDLERAIQALPPQARLVFLLHDVEGYKHAEIAEMTGIAVGTSKAHLHRARRLMRGALQS